MAHLQSPRTRPGGLRAAARLVLLAVCFWTVSAQALERPQALEGVSILDAYVPSEHEPAGRIDRIVGEGRVVVLHRADGTAFFASVEDRVHENDAVYTLGRVRCRILLEDRNVVTMAPESDLIIDEVVLDSVQGQKRSLFEVTRGKALFYAFKLFRYRDMRVRVKTPTATIGVRGTQFGTEIELLPVQGKDPVPRRVASSAPVVLAQEAPARDRLTRVYVAQGRVNVTSDVDRASRDIGENEVIEAGPVGLGRARYDPAAVQSFVDGVEGPMAAAREQGVSTTESAPPDDTAKQQKEEMLRQLDQVEDAKQSQIEQEIEPEHPEHTPGPSENLSTPTGGEDRTHHH